VLVTYRMTPVINLILLCFVSALFHAPPWCSKQNRLRSRVDPYSHYQGHIHIFHSISEGMSDLSSISESDSAPSSEEEYSSSEDEGDDALLLSLVFLLKNNADQIHQTLSSRPSRRVEETQHVYPEFYSGSGSELRMKRKRAQLEAEAANYQMELQSDEVFDEQFHNQILDMRSEQAQSVHMLLISVYEKVVSHVNDIVSVEMGKERNSGLSKSQRSCHTDSPMHFLIHSPSCEDKDKAMRLYFGHSEESFEALCRIVEGGLGVDALPGEKRNGRPRILDNRCKLAVFLMWIRSGVEQKTLQLLFSMSAGSISTAIDQCINTCLWHLPTNAMSKIEFPDSRTVEGEQTLNEWKQLFSNKYPALARFYPVALCDGSVFPVSVPWDHDGVNTQLRDRYHSTPHSMFCNNNVALFSPTGLIVGLVVNKPGSQHDANTMRSMLQEDVGPRLDGSPFTIVADSAFGGAQAFQHRFKFIIPNTRRGNVDGRLFVPEAEVEPFDANNPYADKLPVGDEETDMRYRLTPIQHRQLTSLRQAVEWGWLIFKRKFRIFLGRSWSGLGKDESRKAKVPLVAAYLHNYSINSGERNMLNTVFVEHAEYTSPDANSRELNEYYDEVLASLRLIIERQRHAG